MTPESIKIVVLRESTPCTLVKTHRRFRGAFCCANVYQPTAHQNPVSSDQQRNLSRIWKYYEEGNVGLAERKVMIRTEGDLKAT